MLRFNDHCYHLSTQKLSSGGKGVIETEKSMQNNKLYIAYCSSADIVEDENLLNIMS